ncbi:MAG: hypothetical protein H7X97_14190 [Opitutaceae bacterium]|nr:hypothetical protein [Verrucomicrobiales bacterium]
MRTLHSLTPLSFSLCLAIAAPGAFAAEVQQTVNPTIQSRPATTQIQQGARIPASTRSVTVRKTTTFPVGRIGAQVFSTGTEDVILTMLAGRTGYPMPLYVKAAGQPEKLIATPRNFDPVGGAVFNLGKLPKGELVFHVRSPEGDFYTGSGERNPDKRMHASLVKVAPGETLLVKDPRPGANQSVAPSYGINVVPGEIAVGFEDRLAGRRGSEDPTQYEWDYDDTNFKLTGGVTDDESIFVLMDTYATATGVEKDAAGFALLNLEPKLAKKLGVRVSPEFARKNALPQR